jgi:hypothetical protein
MKAFILIVLAFAISNSLFASELICKGSTDSYYVELKQVGDDVQGTMENKKPFKYRNVGGASVTGKQITILTLSKTDLPTLMKKVTVAEDFFVLMILSRSEFDGEYDMMYSYASDFFHALKCD